MSTQVFRERRRTDFGGRVARVTWPARMTWKEFVADLGGLPCRIIGHNWREVPEMLRRSANSDGKRMRFKCSRCYMVGGFSN